jgi:hypothetical protein
MPARDAQLKELSRAVRETVGEAAWERAWKRAIVATQKVHPIRDGQQAHDRHGRQ